MYDHSFDKVLVDFEKTGMPSHSSCLAGAAFLADCLRVWPLHPILEVSLVLFGASVLVAGYFLFAIFRDTWVRE